MNSSQRDALGEFLSRRAPPRALSEFGGAEVGTERFARNSERTNEIRVRPIKLRASPLRPSTHACRWRRVLPFSRWSLINVDAIVRTRVRWSRIGSESRRKTPYGAPRRDYVHVRRFLSVLSSVNCDYVKVE